MKNEELNEQKGTVTYQLPYQLPPLLAELQKMYQKIFKAAVLTSVVDFLALIICCFLGLALFSRNVIFGGVIILLFAIGSGAVGVMNVKQALKERKFIGKFNADPAFVSWKLLNTFTDDAESAAYFLSLQNLKRMNNAFGFLQSDNYVKKYKFIQAYVLENEEQLSTISSAYSEHTPVITTTPENISKLGNSFSYIPQNNYKWKLRIKLWSYIVLILSIVLVPVSISVNRMVNDPEYAAEAGDTLNKAFGKKEDIKLTAEEILKKYNQVIETETEDLNICQKFYFSDGGKKLINSQAVYLFINDKNNKALSIRTEDENYDGNIQTISVVVPRTDSNIPNESLAILMALSDDINLETALELCHNAKETNKYNYDKVQSICIQYSASDSDFEVWYMTLNGYYLTDLPDDENYVKTSVSSSKEESESSTEEISEENSEEVSEEEEEGPIYSDKMNVYNGTMYYTPVFAGKGINGFLDFSSVKSDYIALPQPDAYDNYGRQLNIDSFIVLGDTVYFADQSQGSDGAMPATLYKMNLNGSDIVKIADNVDIDFAYANGMICYFDYDVLYTNSTTVYLYDIASNKISSTSGNPYLNEANVLFTENNRITFDGGIYYMSYEYVSAGQRDYNIVFYRQDESTGTTQAVGYASTPQGGGGQS